MNERPLVLYPFRCGVVLHRVVMSVWLTRHALARPENQTHAAAGPD